VYPRAAEEVERGALEVMIRPDAPNAQPFLATCALGFRDPAAPTGFWSTPEPEKICAVAGGYAYLVDTTVPERFTMIPYGLCWKCARSCGRPAPLRRPSFHSRVGANGQAWESAKLSDEGVTIAGIGGGVLRGEGWEMMSDSEKAFALDLRTGLLLPLHAG